MVCYGTKQDSTDTNIQHSHMMAHVPCAHAHDDTHADTHGRYMHTYAHTCTRQGAKGRGCPFRDARRMPLFRDDVLVCVCGGGG